jgi:serine/threonine protein kinase
VVNVQPLGDGDPRRLGDYDVTGRLGEGGQGVVYLGRGAVGPVAIKLLHAQLIEDGPARARFVREVEVTKRVARFCTAQVLSAGTAKGRPYIVSEYVPGPSLQRLVHDEGPRRGSALDRLAINTVTALAAIHQAGVVHRDFKPGNVLMGPDGPVVIDFGIARALDAGGTMTSAVSQVIGTPAFMAPEQLAEGTIGPYTDMFAWGITMVFAASGVPAFGHRSIPQVINQILNAEPDLGALDGRLRPAIAACLAKDPSRRPTARRLMDELMGHHTSAPTAAASSWHGASVSPDAGTMRLPGDGPSHDGPAGTSGMPPSTGRPARRTALIIGVTAVLLALVAGVGALAAMTGPDQSPQAVAPPPSPSPSSHRPAKHAPPSPSRIPSHRPIAKKPVRTNPYTPQRLCGGGYRLVDTHRVGEARTYLLYNTRVGTNCVVTMVPRSSGKVFLTASLVVQGGGRESRSGSFPFYAGPIRVPARGKCVMWGGASKTARWTSGWSHCGK